MSLKDQEKQINITKEEKKKEINFITSVLKGIEPKFSKEFLIGSGLYGTIINESYKKNEIKEMVKALGEVCNKKDAYSFHSNCIYFFWNYETKEIYYIGLTNNVLRRFKEHNGLVQNSNTGNKFSQITEYFNENEILGYTLLVRSPINELSPKGFDKIIGNEIKLAMKNEKKNELFSIEGALIEEYRLNYGIIPKWNNIGGSKSARKKLYIKKYGNLFKYVTLTEISDFNSKSTLRELVHNPKYKMIESDLHSIRMIMYKSNKTFLESYKIFMIYLSNLAKEKEKRGIFPIEECLIFDRFEKLLKEDYLNKIIKLKR
ncbi:GIY-YIG nuclease family protein (plasmid) [Fusobacteria bacterium ZRK30]|nr:GIY-YIG nuclease family protein [Fusobacteria bacterium ZRK30]